MRTLFFFMAVLLPALCFSQKNAYTIIGKVPGKEGRVYLKYNKGNQTMVTNEVSVAKGQFVMQGTIDAPYKAYLRLHYPDSEGKTRSENLEFFLDTGTTFIRTPDSLQHAIVTGTPLCADAIEYQRPMDSLLSVLTDAYAVLGESASDAEKEAPVYQRKIAAIDDNFLLGQKKVNTAFIQSHPRSRMNLYIFRELSYFFDYNELASLFNGISKELRNSTAGKDYAARLERLKAVAIGQQAPDFSHPDTSGRMVSLSSFRGKYVLLDFWASWCGPCRGESPYLVAAYNKYQDKGFTIVGVSLDKKNYHKQWLQAIVHDRLYWTQLSDGSDNNPVVKLYGVKGIPQNFLIDPDGKIIAHNLRGPALEGYLSRTLSGSR